MEFCPTCANLLQYEMRVPARLFCRTCPYVCPIRPGVQIRRGVKLQKKEAAPSVIPSGQNIGPQTDASCPKCHHDRATFRQMQTRSADEPMTIFYTCLGCKNEWRED